MSRKFILQLVYIIAVYMLTSRKPSGADEISTGIHCTFQSMTFTHSTGNPGGLWVEWPKQGLNSR